MQPTQRENIISTPELILAILVAILGIVILAVSQAKNTVPSDAPTVTMTTTAKPIQSTLPNFSNFDALIDDGLSDDQLTGLKYAFGLFSSSQLTKAKQVTIDEATVVAVPRDRNSESPNNVINFSVKVDDVSYTAEVDYSSLSPVQLKLFESKGTAQVYDSGVIDINTQTPTN